METQHPRESYAIAWLSALTLEQTAATIMLDDVHPQLRNQPESDPNSYTLGRCGRHNVVIACLPEGSTGSVATAVLASHVQDTFPNVRFSLLVGIGGGIPSTENEMRLGDIVVSIPTKAQPAVVQYDSGKTTSQGWKRSGHMNNPPATLLSAASALQSKYDTYGNKLADTVKDTVLRYPNLARNYAYPGEEKDQLFEANYEHEGGSKDCKSCNKSRLVSRRRRLKAAIPRVHMGSVASGNQVVKYGTIREDFQKQGFLCFEMEAAGLMNDFPCLVIRGIADYADSHKNKAFQGYAALVAAAYAKDLLEVLPERSPGQRGNTDSLVPGPSPTLVSRKPRPIRIENIPFAMEVKELLLCFDETDRDDIIIQQKHVVPSAEVNTQGDYEYTATGIFSPKDCSTRMPKVIDDTITVDDEFIGFTPMNKPTTPIKVDIIAINGLNSHPFTAWATSTSEMWLQTHLPRDIPGARIMTYGFRSRVRQSGAHITEDHANSFRRRLERMRRPHEVQNRPIVIIAHSLGGLILKKALPHMDSLISRGLILCVLFMGVPHFGLSETALRTLCAPVYHNDLGVEFGENSPQIIGMMKSFGSIAPRLNIVACYENSPTQTAARDPENERVLAGPEEILVDRLSAVLYAEPDKVFESDRNHFEMAKVKRGQASEYLDLVHEITTFVKLYYKDNQDSGFIEGRSLDNSPIDHANEVTSSKRHELPGSYLMPASNAPNRVESAAGSPELTLPPPAQDDESHASTAISTIASELSPYPSSQGSTISGLPPPVGPFFLQNPMDGNQMRQVKVDGSHRARDKESHASTAIATVESGLSRYSSSQRPTVSGPPPVGPFFLPDLVDSNQSGEVRVDDLRPQQRQSMPSRTSPPPDQNSPRFAEYDPKAAPEPLKQGLKQASNRHSLPMSPSAFAEDDPRPLPEPLSPDSAENRRNRQGSRSTTSSGTTSEPTSHRNSFLGKLPFYRSRSNKKDRFEIHKAIRDKRLDEAYAIIQGTAEAEQLNKIDPSQSDHTPLHEAVRSRDPELVQLLLDKGVALNPRARGSHYTPLHFAAEAGNVAMVQTLLSAGANVNARDVDNTTPLHLAARKGSVECTNALVEGGANLRALRVGGGKKHSVLDEAKLGRSMAHREIADLLEKAGAIKGEVQPPVVHPGLF